MYDHLNPSEEQPVPSDNLEKEPFVSPPEPPEPTVSFEPFKPSSSFDPSESSVSFEPSAPLEPPEPSKPPKPEKKTRFWPKAVALCLVCTLLAGAGGAVGGFFLSRSTLNTPDAGASVDTVPPSETPDTSEDSDNHMTLQESDREGTVVEVSHSNAQELTLEEIYASWVNSTVGISTEIVTTNYFGQYVSAAAGSGFVISADGYIVTNYHVVEGASTIKVTFYDGTQYDATLVGGEANNDVAVLKIEADGLTPVIIGNSDNLHVGQTVTAIGNPLGELTFSQTAGIVSAKDRTITLSGGVEMNMIQTDCTINSGNSGGPLFNLYGEVIGITSAKYSNNGSYSEATIEGIGFAIPMNDIIDIIKDLAEHGYVTGKPNVGILLDDVDQSALRYGIPAGAEVTAVLEGSCADRGGLQTGDIITAVNDTTVESVTGLQNAVKQYQAGDKVSFTVYRNGSTIHLQLTLDESNQERTDALNALREELLESQQQEQQQSSGNGNSGNGYGYGYNFGWPFGW